MAKLNPKKLTVAKLKSELDARSIEYPSNIKKPQLIELLTTAMDSEGDVSMASNPADDSVVSQDESMSQESTSMAEDNGEPASEAVEEGSGGGDANPKEPEATTADEDAAAQPEPQPEAADEPAEAMEASDELAEAAPAPAEEESADSSEKEVEGAMEQEVAEEKEDATPEKITENGDGETHDDAEKAQDGAEKAQDDADDKDEEKDSESKEDDKDKNAKIEGSKPKHRREETEKERMDRKRRYEERHRKNDERYAPPPDEPEEEFDDTLVVMDKYDSDLNIKFYKDRLTAQVLTLESFAYMWAGARATYGVTAAGNRKVCYECKVTDEHSVRHLPSGHKHRHVARVGWSCNDTPLVLGEQARSYCFCSTAKKVADRKADDFGEEFKKDDVVGCYLDFSDEENFKVSYTKNGKYLGEAFSEEKSKLEEKALFPHILCKNTTIEFNFGEKEEAFFPHPEELEGFEFIGKLSAEDRVRGAVGPATKKECDMLMMCGLPGAGKTQYANKQVEEQPDKRYHILGTNAIMAKMDVTGISQAKPMPRDEKLFHATNCLNRLFQIACRKKRNYIFDQTNVFSSARRKMRTYEGFTRKAVVIVPSDEEYKSRVSKRSKDDGAKDIPEGAVYEMKANFSFPEGDLFEEVIFVELEKAEAEKVVAKYREEARKNGPPPEKRFRGGGYGGGGQRSGGRWSQDKGGRPGGFRQSPAAGRGGYQPPYGGGFRGGQRNGGRGGFGNDRRGGGGWNDKSGGGGWSSGQNRGYGGGRGGYGGNRSSPAGNRGGFNNKSGGGGRGSYGGGGNRNNSGGGYQGNQRNNRNGGAPNAGSQRGGNNRNAQQQPYNYHAAYQQQQAQLAQSAPVPPHQNDAAAYNQAYSQQQNDYSAQWAAYYQQQAQMAQQQQAAAAAAQYQNYYASYAQAYGAYPPPAP